MDNTLRSVGPIRNKLGSNDSGQCRLRNSSVNAYANADANANANSNKNANANDNTKTNANGILSSTHACKISLNVSVHRRVS